MNYDIAPPQASTFAPKVDALFYVISALTAFFTIVVFALVLYFAVKYRKGSKADRSNIVHDSHKIELAWSLPPLVLGLGIFAWGAQVFIEMRTMPKDAIEIFVIGKQWMWHVQHPNGVRENNEIHVPLGKKVKLTMISQDVIHAVYIPAFRAQYQVIPGRYTSLWFEPTKEGKYPLFCNMYCGTQHSEMGGYVYVVKPDEYAQFLERGGDKKKPGAPTSLVERGKELYTKLNCMGCHELNDNVRGPSLHGIAGQKRKLVKGELVTADDDYLRESIIRPEAKIVNGYENTMPQDYKGQLTEEQIRELLEYIKSLTGKSASVTPTPNEGMNP
ncbi:MAG: cytochrome c oxidase subunit II [Methanoregulaceae archaeon]|jgi:cytochrome c oxidase subunit 2|nr:cytochrome c oxidase subunit II [Methanoregulaceae archaeon]